MIHVEETLSVKGLINVLFHIYPQALERSNETFREDHRKKLELHDVQKVFLGPTYVDEDNSKSPICSSTTIHQILSWGLEMINLKNSLRRQMFII